MVEQNSIFRGMSQTELNAAYNNVEAVPNCSNIMADWQTRSDALGHSDHTTLNISYGQRPRNKFDYYSSGVSPAPLFVFIHGGYWQRNDKDKFGFISVGPNANGINVAVVGYTLAPEASLTQIVDEIRAALDFLLLPETKFKFRHDKIFVGGWSAGGHLTALVSDHPAVTGCVPISGIFDLEPIALSDINDLLQLREGEVEALSPLKTLSSNTVPTLLFAGGNELNEIRRQSTIYAEKAKEQNLPVSLSLLDGHDHFSILDELASPEGKITQILISLLRN